MTIIFSAVSKSYGAASQRVHALRSVSLTIESGAITVLRGPSGCGKSTLLAIAGGLLAPDSGEVFVNGTELSALSEDDLCRIRRQSVGYVFQDYNLIDMLTLEENVALPMQLDRRGTRQSAALAREALERVGLGGLADRRPPTLSGGQRQRAAIARALIGERTVLLADEPTGALDRASSEVVMQCLIELAQGGVTCLVATHDDKVAEYAASTVLMADGVVATDRKLVA